MFCSCIQVENTKFHSPLNSKAVFTDIQHKALHISNQGMKAKWSFANTRHSTKEEDPTIGRCQNLLGEVTRLQSKIMNPNHRISDYIDRPPSLTSCARA